MSIFRLLPTNDAYLKPRLDGLLASFSESIADKFHSMVGRSTPYSWVRYPDAVSWLNSTTDALRQLHAPVTLILDDDQLTSKAKALAIRAGWMRGHGACLSHVQALAEQYLVRLPDWTRQPHTEDSVWQRATDASWWKRQIRAAHHRFDERGAIIAGRVHRRAGLYASDDAVKRITRRKRAAREYLGQTLVVNELGQEYSLADLAALSPSNPLIRYAELMVRLRGCEQYAKEEGHACDFFTVTCPSKFHPRVKSGDLNPKFQSDLSPRDAQKHLQTVWSRARSALARKEIKFYGFRVAEPHHDGTPHWHMVLFFDETDRRAIRKILRHYALQVDGKERGAWRRRCTFKTIDLERGSACGYLAKYITKNIHGGTYDGTPLNEYDLESSEKRPLLFTETALRVDAWAKWGIRQFQPVGLPPVTVWREARRLDASEYSDFSDVISLCQANDFTGYMRLMGGPAAKRVDMPVRIYRDVTVNRFGEDALVVKGIASDDLIAISRIHTWSFTQALFGSADAKPTRGSSGGCGGDSRSRTRINNCTESQNSVDRTDFRESLMDEMEFVHSSDSFLIHPHPRWMH